jgi:hypothetical protein
LRSSCFVLNRRCNSPILAVRLRAVGRTNASSIARTGLQVRYVPDDGRGAGPKMTPQRLLIAGGALNLLFALFHGLFPQFFAWSADIPSISSVNQAILYALHSLVVFVLPWPSPTCRSLTGPISYIPASGGRCCS